MINRRFDDRASCPARKSLEPTLERKPPIRLPATWNGGHESGPDSEPVTQDSGKADGGEEVAGERTRERVRHGLAGMIRYRALLIAAGYARRQRGDTLKSDPAFEMGQLR
jgi:hypothetical protein